MNTTNNITERTESLPTSSTPLTADMCSRFVSYIDRGERTTATYLNNLRQFAAWLSFKGITQPTRQDVIAWRDWLALEHDGIEYDAADGWHYRADAHGSRITVSCKPATIASYLQTVRAFFSWTNAEGIYPNIAERIHGPKVSTMHKKDALKPADVYKIERSIKASAMRKQIHAADSKKDTAGRIQRASEQGKRLQAMYELAVNCGLRDCELSRLNCGDIEVVNGQAWLYIQGKGHTEADQRKALASEVYAAIKDYQDSRSDTLTATTPLFVSTGNRSQGRRIAPETVGKMLKKAMQQAGYDSARLTAHSLRHTAGTNVMELTGNIYETQQYMRHSNPATTEIYVHVAHEKQDAVIADKLYDLYHGIDKSDDQSKLESLIAAMDPAQIRQLTNIAAAMSTR